MIYWTMSFTNLRVC